MNAMMTDAQFTELVRTMGLIAVAIIGAISSTLAAYWARTAKQNSAAAKENSAGALNEVRTNGGMSDPNPNMNDHVKYQTEMLEAMGTQVGDLREEVTTLSTTVKDHIAHGKLMDQALAELYLAVKADSPHPDSST